MVKTRLIHNYPRVKGGSVGAGNRSIHFSVHGSSSKRVNRIKRGTRRASRR